MLSALPRQIHYIVCPDDAVVKKLNTYCWHMIQMYCVLEEFSNQQLNCLPHF